MTPGAAGPRAFAVFQKILPLTLVALEFTWAYPWVLLLSGVFYGLGAAPLLPAGSALVLLALGFLVVRAALVRPWTLSRIRTTVVAAGCAAGLAAVKLAYYPAASLLDARWIGALLLAVHNALPAITPAAMGALAATVLWWRGVVLGEREFGYFEVDRAFRRGIGWSVAFVFLLALYGDTRGFVLTQPAPAYLLAFFSVGLSTLAVTRLLALWEEIQADTAQALAANRHWLLMLLGVVGVIFSAAATVAGLVHVEMRPVLGRLLHPLAPAAEFVFYVVFSVAMVMARVIVFVFARLPFRRIDMPTPATTPPSLRDLLKDLPPELVSGALWGMAALVIAILVILVAVSIVRARRRARRKDGDERESVWSGEAVLSGLGQVWRRLWARRRPAARGHDLPAVSAIRAIYRELLQIGAALAAPRAAHQTPYEYRPMLAARLPDREAEIASLTEAYARVRYASSQPDAAEIERARAALDRIKTSVSP